MNPVQEKSRTQLGCMVLLVCSSGFLAIVSYPFPGWKFGAGFGSIALVCIFLWVGWFVPFTIAGIYFGLEFLDPYVKGDDALSMVYETVYWVCVGAIGGFSIGAALDKFSSKSERALKQQRKSTKPEN